MDTFTSIVKYVPEFGIEAYSIHNVVGDIKERLLTGAPRGAKCRTVFTLEEKDPIGWFLIATITLVNMKGTMLDQALIISEQPAVAGQRIHAWGGSPIICKRCGSDQFYDIDRSRDYNNHQCAGCASYSRTITETGASA